MAFVAAVVMGLVALAIAPGYAFYFDVTPKVAVLFAGTAILLVVAARRRNWARTPRLFTVLLALNAISIVLSATWSSNHWLSQYGGSWRCFGAVEQCTVMLFAWLIARQPGARPILWAVVIAGLPMALWGTIPDAGSRAVWLAMSLFFAMALAGMESRLPWRWAARAAAVATLAALVVVCVGNTPWRNVHRQLWRDTLTMAAGKPIAGFGPEVFLAEFPRFESKALAREAPDTIYESPRNALLDTLVAQGLPGLSLLVGFCALGLSAAWKRQERWLAAALVAGLVGLQCTPFAVPTAVLFFGAVGLAVRPEARAEAARSAPLLRAIAPFPVLALLYLTLRVALGDRELVVTRRLIDGHNLRAATAEYEVYWFWRWPGTSADLWYSRNWLEVARRDSDPGARSQALDIAEEAAARAIGSAEEPYLVWYNLAQVAIARQTFDNALLDLKWAIAAHPTWYLPHRALAAELLRRSRLIEAQKEFDAADELAGGSARNGVDKPH